MLNKLKIGIFVYNWPHYKSQSGIFNLCFSGFKPNMAFCADPVELKFYRSKKRTGPKDLYIHNTRDLCDYFNIDNIVIEHNSKDCEKIIKDMNLDVGIILGARILKEHIINAFSIGVINMHPGILPENRGLDNLKWAIIKGLKQGVTTHFIDSNIDRGRMIDQKEINIYKDDTLVDIHMRLQSKEQEMLIEALRLIQDKNFIKGLPLLSHGKNYHRAVPPDIEKDLMQHFDLYLKKIGE